MNDTEKKLKSAVKGLLADKKVDLFIGYEKGTLPLRSRPCFISDPDDADRLVWDSFCSNNLAVYLPRFFQADAHKKKKETPPKIGIVAKGCDIRSIVGLLKENQVSRENIVIVGVPCKGLVDPVKVEEKLKGDSAKTCEEDDKGTLIIKTRTGKTKKIDRDKVVEDACIECRQSLPEGVDILIEGDAKEISKDGFASAKKFEAMSVEERWKYFREEISKCIRCYACRQACPNCYCKVCFVDQTKPRWVAPGNDMTDIMLYHIGRIFHQAGRCVECDACVRACPMGIDLRTFTQKLAEDVKELFDYVPGLSEEKPPLCAFEQEDSQDFITEP